MTDTHPLAFATWYRLPVFSPEDEGGNGATGGEGDAAPQGGEGGDGNEAGKGVLSQTPGNTEGDAGTPPEGEGAGADDGAGEEGGPPETYEFNFQSELEMPDDVRQAYEEAFRDMGLTQEQADRLIQAEEQVMESFQQKQQEMVKQQHEDWTEAAKADKYLGQDWDLTLKRASAGLEKANVSDEFMAILDSTGLSSHPDMIRVVSMLGQVTSNDRFDHGSPTDQKMDTPASWYSSTTPAHKRKG